MDGYGPIEDLRRIAASHIHWTDCTCCIPITSRMLWIGWATRTCTSQPQVVAVKPSKKVIMGPDRLRCEWCGLRGLHSIAIGSFSLPPCLALYKVDILCVYKVGFWSPLYTLTMGDKAVFCLSMVYFQIFPDFLHFSLQSHMAGCTASRRMKLKRIGCWSSDVSIWCGGPDGELKSK